MACATALVAAVLIAMGPANAAYAQFDTTVGPAPAVVEVAVGATSSFTIRVNDAEQLYAGDVRLAFDPTVIEVIDAQPEAPGVQIELLDEFLSPDWVLVNEADNHDGRVWYAVAQLNPTQPVDGSGDLARVSFRGLIAGSTGVTVTYAKITHPSGVPISATHLETIIHVGGGGPTRTPPPTSTITPVPTTPAAPTRTATRTEASPTSSTTPTSTGEPTPTPEMEPMIFLPLVVKSA